MIAQEATTNRSGSEALSGMSNGRRVSRNSLDTRNMAQFISLQPTQGINYDAAAEEVLAKVLFGPLSGAGCCSRAFTRHDILLMYLPQMFL